TYGETLAGQKPEFGAQLRKYVCGCPLGSAQKRSMPSFSTLKLLQVMVVPGAFGSWQPEVEPTLKQPKITPSQSYPAGQSASVWQSTPQNWRVWPSPMNTRQVPLFWLQVNALFPTLQSRQSTRPGCSEHTPVLEAQNWFGCGHSWLSRQKSWHWPETHACRSGHPSSRRHPFTHRLPVQICPNGQWSSNVQAAVGMQVPVVMSQNVGLVALTGQSRSEVQASDWQNPSPLQYCGAPPGGGEHPWSSLHRQVPVAWSQRLCSPLPSALHEASVVQTQRLVPTS